jgi:cell division protein FtsB
MRYWGSESKVSRTGRTASSSARKGARSSPAKKSTGTRSKVAAGGSVQPFLRRVYQHQTALSAPVQKVLFFLVLAGILYAFVLGDAGAIRIAVLRHQRAQADRDIADLKQNVALLEHEINRLEKDAFYIEKVARERYGYVRPGERVFKIVPPRNDD